MKFCVDCKNYSSGYADVGFCKSPELGRSLVTGSQIVKMCGVVRKDDHRCGEKANWFESKEQQEVEVKKGFIAWLTKLF